MDGEEGMFQNDYESLILARDHNRNCIAEAEAIRRVLAARAQRSAHLAARAQRNARSDWLEFRRLADCWLKLTTLIADIALGRRRAIPRHVEYLARALGEAQSVLRHRAVLDRRPCVGRAD